MTSLLSEISALRIRAVAMSLGVAFSSIIGLSVFNPLLVRAATAGQNSAKVSFTFDDGLESALTKAAPTLQAHGLTGTDYIITGCVGLAAPSTPSGNNGCAADGTKAYMSWDDITTLHGTYGWEIGSHTVDHSCMADSAQTDPDDCANAAPLTAAQLETELAGSQQTLATHGFTATDFAWPYGDYNDLSLSVAAKYYATTRGFADNDSNNTYPYNDLILHDQQFQAGAPTSDWALCADMSVAGAETCIDNAITNNQWVVLVFHNITDTPDTSEDSYDEATSNLDAIAAYAAARQQAGQLKVVNVSDGTATGVNLLPNGDFVDGIADGWTTDDATDITADSNNNGRYPEPVRSVMLKSDVSGADSHLFSPKVSASYGQTYILKNYVNLLNGGSVNFYIDEFDASGNPLTGVDPNAGIAYTAPGAKGINVSEVSFSYTPSSAAVATASLQVIVKGANTQAYYDGAQWFDATAPVISGVTQDGITTTGVTIGWATSEAATTQVQYGTTTAYGSSTTLDTALVTTHGAIVSGLSVNTTYYYQIMSSDASGNTATAIGSFTTANAVLKPGDANGDGIINIKDATLVSLNWGKTGATRAQGDLNGDGLVNIKDATLVSLNWGK